MNFISYAQNFEDVMLWRALGHIQGGFYVDVGACDPEEDSVTKAFYDRGWTGINIEPLPSHINDLNRERPKDINLQMAAGDARGEIVVFEYTVRGWGTVSHELAQRYSDEGYESIAHKCEVRTLQEIFEENVSGEIHFLKIDVEGHEQAVIRGMAFSENRPWIIVIEATKPNSVEEAHHEWEAALLENSYILSYADGLNRYYVAEEKKELLPAFRYPPNIFDGFINSQHFYAHKNLQEAEARIEGMNESLNLSREELAGSLKRLEKINTELEINYRKVEELELKEAATGKSLRLAETKILQLESDLKNLQASLEQATSALDIIFSSWSWKITSPFRFLSLQVRLLREHGIYKRLVALARKLRGLESELLKVDSIEQAANESPSLIDDNSSINIEMTSSAKRIHEELKCAARNHRE